LAKSLGTASARRRISARRSLAAASSAGTDPSDSTRAISASRRSRSACRAAIRVDGSGSVSRASEAKRSETLASRDDVTVATGRSIASRKAMASAAVGDSSMLSSRAAVARRMRIPSRIQSAMYSWAVRGRAMPSSRSSLRSSATKVTNSGYAMIRRSTRWRPQVATITGMLLARRSLRAAVSSARYAPVAAPTAPAMGQA